jgi:hypothetical protein
MVSRHRVEREAVESALAHSEGRGDGEYELRFPSVRVIVRRPIIEPDAPALGTPVALSETQLRVPLDRPATGPTTINYYTLERSPSGAGSFSQVAQGIGIFPFDDSGLAAATSYDYRANATDTTERTSVWGYATGTTSSPSTIPDADYTIAAGTSSSTFEGSVVSAGEIIEFAPGTHGPRTIQNLAGTALNPIIVRSSESGRAIIRRTTGSSGGFVLSFRNCQYVTIDGSYTPGQTYGIKVMQASSGTDSPSAYIQFWDNSTGVAAETPTENITIRYVDVDGNWSGALNAQRSIGIQFNDSAFLAASYPALTRNGLVIEYCRIQNVEGEGIYMGPNFSQGHLPIENCHIRYNTIYNTGWDGIQMKMSTSGTNTIHHNTVTHVGKRADTMFYQHYGIAIDSGQGNIYANYVADTGHHGIQVYTNGGPTGGPFATSIYNNVVVRAGTYNVAGDDTDGIVAGSSSAGVALVEPKIYSNTIISPHTRAVDVNSYTPTGLVKNNIVFDSTGINAPGGVVVLNNPTTATFVNSAADNYRLSAATTAASGTLGVDISSSDFDGVVRDSPDCGAFEYI